MPVAAVDPTPRPKGRDARRRRPDWPVTVYAYDVSPDWGTLTPDNHGWDRTPPAAVLAEAATMQQTWNACVARWEAHRARYEAVRDQDEALRQARTRADEAKRARDAAYQALKQTRQRLAADLKARSQRLALRQHPAVEAAAAVYAAAQLASRLAADAAKAVRAGRTAAVRGATQALRAQLGREVYEVGYQASEAYWAHKLHLLDSFRATVGRFFQGVGRPPTRHDGPVRDIHLEHHLMDGGLPIEQLFTPCPRFAFEPPNHSGKARGLFRMAGQVELPFKITWHRLPPDGSYLKKLRLIGHQRSAPGVHRSHLRRARWDWSLQLTLEVPPEPVPPTVPPDARPVAAIDLNWRRTDQGIRLGVLLDTDGQRQDVYLPAPVYAAWDSIRARQVDQAAALARATVALAEITDLPAGWRRALPQLGRATLYQWLQRCEDAEEGLTPAQRRVWGGALRTWAHTDT